MENENELEETAAEETAESTEPVAEQTPEPTPEDNREFKESWKELRTKAARAEQAERERDEALRYARMLMEAKNKPQEEEPEVNLNDDEELLDVKTLKKVLAQEDKKRKRLEQEIQESNRLSHEDRVYVRLQREFEDFDEVLSQKNIAALARMDPDLAQILYNQSDLEKKSKATYNAIKRYGIYDGQDTLSADKNLIKKNAVKPKSLASIAATGTSPLDITKQYAEAQSEEYRAKLLAKMEESLARVGNLVPRV